ncbi:hypothetical protein B0A50_03982 [Salinomyces thailandicus]|uniref:NOL1/NOP2/Sun domain family member 4 n=1 Tax=Salinomyces thailandicus TaxID=706561 RepID=A0A4U0TZK7_9PEZI|nr:hypothetical protein B0A50_03982 [Salinomyces thailandica]
MTKTARNTAAAAEESFHKHYAAIWGAERWRDSLYPALEQPTRYAALVNRFVSTKEFWQAITEAQLSTDELETLEFPATGGALASAISCYARKAEDRSNFPPPRSALSGLLTHWNLDAASALAAHLLDARPGDLVLDLCAAPGGKSVVLAQLLFPELYAGSPSTTPSGSALRSNEADPRRQKRLAENLVAYIPKQANSQCVRVDGTGSTLGGLIVPGGYDKVLVDAPCSSERHIIHAHLKAKASGNIAPDMANWRPGSSKRLAQTQLALLMTAIRAVKVGGTVMYATCSLDSTENDGVLEKMVAQHEKERKKGAVKWRVEVGLGNGEEVNRLRDQLAAWAEQTKHGWIILPDHPSGGRWGPLFFTLITKRPEK